MHDALPRIHSLTTAGIVLHKQNALHVGLEDWEATAPHPVQDF